jgi:hypothetical protein
MIDFAMHHISRRRSTAFELCNIGLPGNPDKVALLVMDVLKQICDIFISVSLSILRLYPGNCQTATNYPVGESAGGSRSIHSYTGG